MVNTRWKRGLAFKVSLTVSLTIVRELLSFLVGESHQLDIVQDQNAFLVFSHARRLSIRRIHLAIPFLSEFAFL